MSMSNIDSFTFSQLVNGSENDKLILFNLINSLVDQTKVLTGSVAPTFNAKQHQWYLDVVAQKYYRNVDGGTTWVALN